MMCEISLQDPATRKRAVPITDGFVAENGLPIVFFFFKYFANDDVMSGGLGELNHLLVCSLSSE